MITLNPDSNILVITLNFRESFIADYMEQVYNRTPKRGLAKLLQCSKRNTDKNQKFGGEMSSSHEDKEK